MRDHVAVLEICLPAEILSRDIIGGACHLVIGVTVVDAIDLRLVILKTEGKHAQANRHLGPSTGAFEEDLAGVGARGGVLRHMNCQPEARVLSCFQIKPVEALQEIGNHLIAVGDSVVRTREHVADSAHVHLRRGNGPERRDRHLRIRKVAQGMHREGRRLILSRGGEEAQLRVEFLGSGTRIGEDALQIVARPDQKTALLIHGAHRRHRTGIRPGILLPLRPLLGGQPVGPLLERLDDLLLHPRGFRRRPDHDGVDQELAARREADRQWLRGCRRPEAERAEVLAGLDLNALLLPADAHGEVVVLPARSLAAAANDVDLDLPGRCLHQEGILAVADMGILGDRIGPDRRMLSCAPALVLHRFSVGAHEGLQPLRRLPAIAGGLGVNRLRGDRREPLPHARLLRAHIIQERRGLGGSNAQQQRDANEECFHE